MANQLSDHFFYFFAKDQAPPDYQPVLQVFAARKTVSGYRMKLFDGVFHFSACYLQGDELIDKFQDFVENYTPTVRILSWEKQTTKKNVFYINDMEILDQSADGSEVEEKYPISDPTVYDDYISSNGFTLLNAGDDLKPPANKRQRTVECITYRVSIPPTNVLHSYRSPSKVVSTSINVRSPAQPRFPSTSVRYTQDQNITPLNLITPYVNRWRICGIVTFKEKIREVSTASKGTMRVMSFHLCDDRGQTIKITAWNDLADDVNATVIESNSYYVSGDQGCIRKKNIRFNNTDCDYEITMNSNCQVTQCLDRHFEIPKFVIKRTLLSELSPDKHCVDVLAVIDKIGEASNMLVKSKSEEVLKREMHLVDESNTSVALTLWAEKAAEPFGTVGDVVGIKGVLIKEFNGSLTLSLIGSSVFEVNPELPDTPRLLQWYENQRPTADIKSMSTAGSTANFGQDLRTLGVIKLSNMCDGAQNGFHFYTKVEITEIRKDSAYYPACITCNKKVTAVDNGFKCDKCSTTNAQFHMRYNLSLQLCDGTDTIYVTLFDEHASALLGISAQDLDNLRQNGDERAYQAYFTPLMFRSIALKAKVRLEMYNDQKSLKYTVFQVMPIPFPQYSQALDQVLKVLEDL